MQHVLRLPSPAYTLVVLCGQVPQRLSGRLLWFHLVLTHVAQYQCALLVLLRDARRLDLEVPLLSGLILLRGWPSAGARLREKAPVADAVEDSNYFGSAAPRRKLLAAEKKA